MSRNNCCRGIPSGYRAEKSGATYRIKDVETGEIVSFGYHEIDFPNVKLGAWESTLVKHNGLFIPEGRLPAAIQGTVDDPNRELREFEKKVYEAYKDYGNSYMRKKSQSGFRKLASMRSSHNSSKSESEEDKIENLKEKYESGELSIEEFRDRLESKTEETDVQEVMEDVEAKNNTEKEIVADKEKYITILCAKIAGVLEQDTKDWHILTSYENVSADLLASINSVEDVKQMNHPYGLTDRDLQRLESADEINSQDWKEQNRDLLSEFVEEEYSF